MKRQDVSGQNTLHTDGSGGAGTSVDITAINGVAPSTGLGASDAGTLRVAISSDSPSAGNPAAGATGAAVPADADYQGVNVAGTLRGATAVNPSGSIFAQQTDIASVAGITAATGNGTTTAGTQRVTISSDSTGQIALAAGAAVIGHVITDATSTTIATQATGTNLHTVVDSGSITVTQGTGTNLHAVLDAGAAIIGKVVIDQTTPGTTNGVALEQIGSTTVATGNGVVGAGVQRVAIASDNTAFAVTATVSGTVTNTPVKATTSVLANVAGSASSVTLLASNAARLAATIDNDSTAILYAKFGVTASTSSFTVKVPAGAYYEVPGNYTGIIDGIWASATGSARVTELTA